MSNSHHEALSAVIDGEATELERARVLRDLSGGDVELSLRWERWHLIGEALRGGRVYPVTGAADRFLIALAAEQPHAGADAPAEASAAPATGAMVRRVFGGLAVAASVAFAVVLGTEALRSPATDQQLPAIAGTPTLSSSSIARPVVARRERAEPIVLAAAPIPAEDAVVRERVRMLMLHHAQQAALSGEVDSLPLARVAAFESRGH